MIKMVGPSCLKSLAVLVASMLALNAPVLGEDRMVLGPRQMEMDKTPNGAVLCAWTVYLAIQMKTATCGWTRRPIDDAIDEAIVAIDEFVLTNSSLHPSRAALEDFKRRTADTGLPFLRQQGFQKFCEGPDMEGFRSASPDLLRASVKKLLALPREPVMSPCL